MRLAFYGVVMWARHGKRRRRPSGVASVFAQDTINEPASGCAAGLAAPVCKGIMGRRNTPLAAHCSSNAHRLSRCLLYALFIGKSHGVIYLAVSSHCAIAFSLCYI